MVGFYTFIVYFNNVELGPKQKSQLNPDPTFLFEIFLAKDWTLNCESVSE